MNLQNPGTGPKPAIPQAPGRVSVSMTSATVLLAPGIGADHRLFAEMLPLIPGASIATWPRPNRNEKLGEMAARWAESLPAGPRVVIGFSFGGMVAMEAAARSSRFAAETVGIVLVSSCRSREAITTDFKGRARGLAFIPDPALRLGLTKFSQGFSPQDDLTADQRGYLQDMAKETDLGFFRWAVGACAQWDFAGPEAAGLSVPVIQIHGSRDTVIPPVPGHADETWNAGHLLTYTHPRELLAVARRMAEDRGMRLAGEPVGV